MGLQIWGKKWCDYLHQKDLIKRSGLFLYITGLISFDFNCVIFVVD